MPRLPDGKRPGYTSSLHPSPPCPGHLWGGNARRCSTAVRPPSLIGWGSGTPETTRMTHINELNTCGNLGTKASWLINSSPSETGGLPAGCLLRTVPGPAPNLCEVREEPNPAIFIWLLFPVLLKLSRRKEQSYGPALPLRPGWGMLPLTVT